MYRFSTSKIESDGGKADTDYERESDEVRNMPELEGWLFRSQQSYKVHSCPFYINYIPNIVLCQ